MLGHQLADGLRVERVGVIDGADARQQRHPQQPVRPKAWKNGSTPMILSVGAIHRICATPSTFESRLWWESSTPFGTPVAAAREQHGGNVVGLLAAQTEEPGDQPLGSR